MSAEPNADAESPVSPTAEQPAEGFTIAETETAVVEKVAYTGSPEKQRALVEISTPTFSHNDELPLRISIAKSNWWGRKRLSVRTTEEVWYQDAVLKVKVAPNSASDLGSIPPLVWWLISPWDIALESLFHDELYKTQLVRRYVADTALRSMMEERGKPWWVVLLVYLNVRLFGGLAWRKHTEENAVTRAAASRPDLPE